MNNMALIHRREGDNYMVRRMGKPKRKPFDPEGSGYDYETAKKGGLKPGSDGHWPSRDPKTGQVLKGRKHETYHKAVKSDKEKGYEHHKGKNGRYYSIKRPDGDPK